MVFFRIFPGFLASFACCALAQTQLGQAWEQEIIRENMSYSYGFGAGVIHPEDGTVLSYADSYSMVRPRVDENAILYLRHGEEERVIARESFQFLGDAIRGRHVLIERQVFMDVNCDGRNDIVTAVNSHGSVVAYLSPKTKSGAWERRVLSSDVPGVVNLHPVDFDNDGDLDIVLAKRLNLSRSRAEEVPHPGVGILSRNADCEWMYSDIDSPDGALDIRTVQSFEDPRRKRNVVVVAPGVGDELLLYSSVDGQVRKRSLGSVHVEGHYMLVTRVNDKPHFVYSDGSSLRMLDLTKRDPQSEKLVDYAEFGDEFFVSEIATGDLDKAGRDEIVFATKNHGIYVLAQSEAGVQLHQIAYVPNCLGMALVDVDNDGWLDVVANSEYDWNAIVLFRNPIGRSGEAKELGMQDVLVNPFD